MKDINVKPGEFPYKLSEGPDESRYLTWVRNHSNYMAERGFLDYMRIVAVLVRGILINFLTLLPYFLLAALLLLTLTASAAAQDALEQVLGLVAGGLLDLLAELAVGGGDDAHVQLAGGIGDHQYLLEEGTDKYDGDLGRVMNTQDRNRQRAKGRRRQVAEEFDKGLPQP